MLEIKGNVLLKCFQEAFYCIQRIIITNRPRILVFSLRHEEFSFCDPSTDLCGYVKEILGVENLIYNLQPVAQKLELSMELRRQVVSCWQNEEKQLEVILQNWSEKQGDDADPAFLRKTLGELEPKG